MRPGGHFVRHEIILDNIPRECSIVIKVSSIDDMTGTDVMIWKSVSFAET